MSTIYPIIVNAPVTFSQFRKPGTIPLLEEQCIRKLSDKYEKTRAQIALRHGIDRGLCIVPKSKTPARLVENLQVRLKLPGTDWKVHEETYHQVS